MDLQTSFEKIKERKIYIVFKDIQHWLNTGIDYYKLLFIFLFEMYAV